MWVTLSSAIWGSGVTDAETEKPSSVSNKTAIKFFENFELPKQSKKNQRSLFYTCEVTTLKKMMPLMEDSEQKELILDFARKIIEQSKEKSHSTIQIETERYLSSVIYLAGVNYKNLASLIDPLNFEQSLEKVCMQCREDISNVLAGLMNVDSECTIQEKEMLRATHLPIAIAKILTTPIGIINSKLIPLVIELMNREGSDFDNFIKIKLNEIALKYPLRQEISLARKPNDESSDMNLILRSYLNLGSDEKITDIHAIQATLASLLTILHQGPVGSCFATSEAKQVQDEQPKWFVKDMRLLIQTGELVRIVGKEKMQFPFVPKIADDDLAFQLQLDTKGNISEKHFSILECLGIKEALMAMRISEPKEHLEEVIKKVLESKKITVDNFIDIFAKTAIKEEEHIQKKHAKWGKLAFSLQTNSIGRILEYTMASMAAAPVPSHNSKMDDLFGALKFNLKLTNALQQLDKSFAKAVLSELKESFLDHFHYKYDPDVNSEGSNDGSSHFGAFVLYAKEPGLTMKHWKRLKKEEMFKEHLLKAFDGLSSMKEWTNDSEKKEGLASIRSLIQNSNFMGRFKMSYALMSISDTCSIDETWISKVLKKTPWMLAEGDSEGHVFSTYTETEFNYEHTQIIPKNAESLIYEILKFCQSKQDLKTQYLTRVDGLHDFNFTPFEDPALRKMANDKSISLEEQIKRKLITPNQMIADQTVSKGVKKELCKFVKEKIPASFEEFKKKLTSQDWQKMSVFDFYQTVLRLFKEFSTDETVLLSLNNNLLQHALIDKDREAIAKSALLAFDTNWNSGQDQTIYFAFFFNPATKEIELGTINHNRTSLRLIGSLKWVKGATWRIFTERMADIKEKEILI